MSRPESALSACMDHREFSGRTVVQYETLIRSCVRDRLPRRHRRHLEDVEQDVRLALLTKLAKYDPSRGAISTFLYVAVGNLVADLVRKLDRQHVPSELRDYDRPAPDRSADRSIERLADSILHQPTDYLTKRQAAALAVVQHGRGAVAERLGINLDSASDVIYRIRQRLRQAA